MGGCRGAGSYIAVTANLGRQAASSRHRLHAPATAHIRSIDRFLAVSDFVQKKHVQAGIATERIGVTPQFAWPTARREGPGDYFLYVGRLTRGRARTCWSKRGHKASAGSSSSEMGPRWSTSERWHHPMWSFVAWWRGDAVPALLRGARALLVPSLANDPAPRSVTEAFAAGIPVVASRSGGLPEAIEQGKSGLLVTAGAADEWKAAVEMLSDELEAIRLGDGAWRMWSERIVRSTVSADWKMLTPLP